MPDEGLYVTTASDARGQWSEPYLLLSGKGLIDPCPFWDDDGQAYIAYAYAGSRAGIRNKLHVRPVTPDLTKVLGDGKLTKKLTVLAGWFSKSAHQKIAAAGGAAQNDKGEAFEFPKPKKKFVPREGAPKKSKKADKAEASEEGAAPAPAPAAEAPKAE